MDFLAVILFAQQVFHWECYLFLILLIHDIYRYYFGSYLCLILLLKVLHIKGHVFYSSKNEQILLPHEFIFVFIIGTILSKCIAKRGNGHVERLYLCNMYRSRQPLLNFFVTTVHINQLWRYAFAWNPQQDSHSVQKVFF